MIPKWLLVTSHDNWDHFAAAGAWAFDKSTRMNGVEPGDPALVYLTGNDGISSIGGVVTFLASSTQTSDRRGGPFTLHPFHVPVHVDHFLASPLPFEQLRPHLQFLPDSRSWGMWMRGKPIKGIPPQDGTYLLGTVEEAVRKWGKNALPRLRSQTPARTVLESPK